MEEESISDDIKVNEDIFSHASKTLRDNKNDIFKSEKIDNSDKLADT